MATEPENWGTGVGPPLKQTQVAMYSGVGCGCVGSALGRWRLGAQL